MIPAPLFAAHGAHIPALGFGTSPMTGGLSPDTVVAALHAMRILQLRLAERRHRHGQRNNSGPNRHTDRNQHARPRILQYTSRNGNFRER